MPNNSSDLRDQLLSAETMTPALRESYRQKLDGMLHPPMTWRSALPGVAMLVVLLPIPVLIARVEMRHYAGILTLSAHAVFAAACLFVCFLVLRDIRRRKHSRLSTLSAANALTAAAGLMTIASMLLGLRAPASPKSLFDVFFLFIFYFACSMWSLDSRIQASELSAREQALRLEYRIADLAERLENH